MHRLALALTLALVPIAFVTSASAQTAPDDAVKTLWCGEAFTALFLSEKPQVTPDMQGRYDTFFAAATKLVDNGTQGYLNAGFTEEQVTKVKSDLVTEVTPIVTGDGSQAGKFTPDQCNALLHALIPPDTDASAPASDGSAPASTGSSADATSPSVPASSSDASSASQ